MSVILQYGSVVESFHGTRFCLGRDEIKTQYRKVDSAKRVTPNTVEKGQGDKRKAPKPSSWALQFVLITAWCEGSVREAPKHQAPLSLFFLLCLNSGVQCACLPSSYYNK